MQIQNFDEARQALRPYYFAYTYRDTRVEYKLDRMYEVLTYLHNPQDKLRVVHIAGTSGKSSTAYYAAALLEASGATVGLTVSPHIREINERIQINHTPLAEKDFCDSLGTFLDLINASGIKPSYFELMVAFAFYEFARRNVDYAVVEVGLGGLLDCTNVVHREDKVCVITDIGFDHTNVLGKTLAAIAGQKAGIIQQHNHVFMHPQSEEIMHVIHAAVRKKQAQLHEVGIPRQLPAVTTHLPLFQARNFHLAQQTVQYVLARDGYKKLTSQQLTAAKAIYVPGRMEIFRVKEKILIVDGAHNGQKMAALLESVRAIFPNMPLAALVAFVGARDDRWQHALSVLTSETRDIIATTFEQESDEMPKVGMSPTTIEAYLISQGVWCDVEPDLIKAYQKLLEKPEPLLLVVGSLYMLGDVLKRVEQYDHDRIHAGTVEIR